MEAVGTCTLLTGLGLSSVIDIKIRKVSLKIVGIMFVVGCMLRIMQENFLELALLIGLLPGIVCLLLSWLTKGEIGAGDGCMRLALGAFMDFWEVFSVFTVAISLVGVVALILMLRFHKGKKYEIPFIPFLFLGCFVIKIVCGG